MWARHSTLLRPTGNFSRSLPRSSPELATMLTREVELTWYVTGLPSPPQLRGQPMGTGTPRMFDRSAERPGWSNVAEQPASELGSTARSDGRLSTGAQYFSVRLAT